MWRVTSILITVVLILLALGVVMLASTSSVLGETRYGNPHHFVVRQIIWVALGLVAAFATSLLDYHHWRRIAVPLALFCAVLLIMAVTPGVGLSVKGSSRWLRLGPLTFQPSELAKLSVVALLSWWMAHVQRRASEFKVGLLVPLCFLGLMWVWFSSSRTSGPRY